MTRVWPGSPLATPWVNPVPKPRAIAGVLTLAAASPPSLNRLRRDSATGAAGAGAVSASGPDEDLAASARHTLERTTGLAPRHLEQLYSFGAVDRSPERVVSIVYWALVRPDEDARAIDGDNVEWFVADEVPELAFDHSAIVQYALDRLRAKITYSPIAYGFLTDEFTLAQVREVYEAVLRRPLDPANFRRQVLATHALQATGAHLTGTSHRPPALYRFDRTQIRPALTFEESR